MGVCATSAALSDQADVDLGVTSSWLGFDGERKKETHTSCLGAGGRTSKRHPNGRGCQKIDLVTPKWRKPMCRRKCSPIPTRPFGRGFVHSMLLRTEDALSPKYCSNLLQFSLALCFCACLVYLPYVSTVC